MLYMHYNSLLGGWLRPLGSGSDADDMVVLLFVKTHTHDYARCGSLIWMLGSAHGEDAGVF
jgi:hypothetical protein